MAKANSRAGASTSRTTISQRLRIWRTQHRKQAAKSFGQLVEHPLASSMALLILTVAILLPSLLFLALNNIEQWVKYSDNGLEVSAYLHHETNKEEASQLMRTIEQWEGVASTRYISPDQAMGMVIRSTAMNDIAQSLPGNPLPPTILVALEGIDNIQVQAEKIAVLLAAQPMVESLNYNAGWFTKAQALVELGRRLALGLSLNLALGVMLVVSNTVRLAIERHSEEILVSRLVGATNAYIRRPFLYMGVWLGTLGVCFALLATQTSWLVLTYLMRPIEQAYNTQIAVSNLPLPFACLVFFGCIGLSWLSAWFISSHHIHKIEPGLAGPM